MIPKAPTSTNTKNRKPRASGDDPGNHDVEVVVVL